MNSVAQRFAAAANENDRAHYETRAAGLDRQIDELTYEIYGLMTEEKDLVAEA